jgi:hypothetical protein
MFCAVDDDGDKTISREEFLDKMNNTEFLTAYHAILKRVDFMAVLKSRPASLSLMEFLCLLYPRLKPADMKVVMRWCYERDAMDIFKGGKDRIGKTTQDEWHAIFTALDTDGSGKISVKELQDANILSPGELYRYLAMHDENQDGEVSLAEFMQVIHKKVQESKITVEGDDKDALLAVSDHLSLLYHRNTVEGHKPPRPSRTSTSLKLVEAEIVTTATEDTPQDTPSLESPSGQRSSKFGFKSAKVRGGTSSRFGRSHSEGPGNRSRKAAHAANSHSPNASDKLWKTEPLVLPLLADGPTSPSRMQEAADEMGVTPIQTEDNQESSPNMPQRTPSVRRQRPHTSPKGVSTPRLLIVERWDPENPKNFPIPPRTPVVITKKRPPLFRG